MYTWLPIQSIINTRGEGGNSGQEIVYSLIQNHSKLKTVKDWMRVIELSQILPNFHL